MCFLLCLVVPYRGWGGGFFQDLLFLVVALLRSGVFWHMLIFCRHNPLIRIRGCLMKKNFVFDTNVLLHDPRAIFHFEDNNVVIPIYVIEELDSFKKHANELGRNARQLARYIDQYRKEGCLSGDGATLPNGGNLRVLLTDTRHTVKTEGLFQDKHMADNKILALALDLKEREPDIPLIFISKDTNLRIRGDAVGLHTEDYDPEAVTIDELYKGFADFKVSAQLVDKIFDREEFSVDELQQYLSAKVKDGDEHATSLYPNQYLWLQNIGDEQHSAVARIEPDGKAIKALSKRSRDLIWGIRGRNREQNFALDLLLDERIKLISLVGKAGTGKTLLAIAAGLQCTVEEQIYQKLLVSRPILPMGRDLGYLPGTIEEKLSPWMQPIVDNTEFLMGLSQQDKRQGRGFQELIEMGMLEIEPLTYIRGRSIPQQFMIIDECVPYETPVVTEEGPRKIGGLFSLWIRDNKLPRVKSFDPKQKRFVWKDITCMWHRGKKALCEVQLSNRKIRCTENHPFLTDKGWIPANELQSGDLVVASHPHEHQVLMEPTEVEEQILLGSFLGDGSISSHGESRYRLTIIHGQEQEEYCRWKADILHREVRSVFGCGDSPEKPKYTFSTKMFGDRRTFPLPKDHCPQWVLDTMDVRALAIWFMDDGRVDPQFNSAHLHTESFDQASVVRMSKRLEDFGIQSKPMKYKDKHFILSINAAGYRRLSQLIAPLVPPSMAYKIHPDDRHAIGQRRWDNPQLEWGYVVVKGVKPLPGMHHVFDMEVDELHNFLIPSASRGKGAGQAAVVVHNSQNLTPHEVKTIISRAGENTKIVLTGDPYQIDHPYVDASDNGLVHTVNRFIEQGIAGHVTLIKGERSELAELAANLL